MKFKLLLSATTSVTLLAVVGNAPFATAQNLDQAQAGAASGLEEIVVTARRREEKLQSVPISITAFSSAEIRAKSIVSAYDLQQFVPSLNVSSNTQRDTAVYAIRGQGYTLGAGPGVVSYFAEVPIPPIYFPSGLQPPAGGPGLYYDLENLQVLKGPQGTLFGRNTTGGAVLFEPQRPTKNFEGDRKSVV